MPEQNRVVTVRARSLKNAEASYISVVDRGANRLPIRMLKNEGENMFDLNKLFLRGSQKNEQAQPAVMGVLVPEASAQGYAAALKSDSQEVFVLDTDTNGVKFVSLKEEASLDGAMILQGATETSPAIVVDTAQKMLSDFGFDPEQGFAGSVVSHGFYSNLDGAMRVLFDAMWSVMETAEPGEAPVERVQTLLTEFTAYVTALMQTVPMEAFKMEKLQPVEVNQDDQETTTAEASKGEGAVEGEVVVEGAAVEGEAVVEGEAATEGGEVEGGAAVVEGSAEGEAPVVEAGEASKSEGDEGALAQILSQISTFGEQLQGIKSEISTVKETVTQQGEELQTVRDGVQKAEQTAQEAIESASSVVIDTEDGRTNSQKADDDYNPDHVDRRNRNIEYT
ncbi:VHS1052 protein [Vibrio phage 1]|nr:VHS1052 protein [Vibrio phage 1]